MVIAGDTSFYFSLYGNDVHSATAVSWTASCRHPLTLSPFNSFEFGNALRLAEFRKVVKPEEAAMSWSQFQAAMRRGRLVSPPCNLADVLDEATRLSSTHTGNGGHRAFDIFHVAAALVMGAGEFLTFDENQRKLAKAEGFSMPF